MTTFAIAGGGLAGAKAAETLRAEGFDGTLWLLSDEEEVPYERPPLSKGYLLGKDERDSAYVHPAGWYAEHDVELRSGVTVSSIDPKEHVVAFQGGKPDGYAGGLVEYDKLLLATGAAPKRLDVPGADLEGVQTLRRLADSDALRAAFRPGARVVIVGAGWIGLEAAAAARAADAEVTVVEPKPTALHDVLGPELGAVFAKLHADHGVMFRFGETVREFRSASAGGQLPQAQLGSVVTSAGAVLPADIAVVGIGVAPNDSLASAAGLAVDEGVLTNASLQTSDPDIYAAGDVARSFNPLYDRRIRVDHWSNALNGGPAAARAMLGQEIVYDRVPYFFSDQYDLGMECTGLPSPGTYDQVAYRGDPDGLEFIAFWLNSGAVVAGMNVNVWDVTDDIQDLIRSARPVDVSRLSDPGVPLPEV
ncbi:MAG TPA: FAD-dependent oxidoreductase [Trebonia sp.]|jgi:3-phenylpropionate/trans-cinnamate dioxygenase ferredoxin reductase subunit